MTAARRILILGGGFGGIYVALELEKVVARREGLDGHSHDLPYDHLILALGSSTNFFGLPGVEQCALTKVRVALDWTLDLCFAKDFACVTAGPGASRNGARVDAVPVEQARAGAAAL